MGPRDGGSELGNQGALLVEFSPGVFVHFSFVRDLRNLYLPPSTKKKQNYPIGVHQVTKMC